MRHEDQQSNPADCSLCSGLPTGSLATAVLDTPGESKLKIDNEGIPTMFPSSHWWKWLHFSPVEWTVCGGQDSPGPGEGGSKERWFIWEPSTYGLVSGLNRPGGECNKNRTRRKDFRMLVTHKFFCIRSLMLGDGSRGLVGSIFGPNVKLSRYREK